MKALFLLLVSVLALTYFAPNWLEQKVLELPGLERSHGLASAGKEGRQIFRRISETGVVEFSDSLRRAGGGGVLESSPVDSWVIDPDTNVVPAYRGSVRASSKAQVQNASRDGAPLPETSRWGRALRDARQVQKQVDERDAALRRVID